MSRLFRGKIRDTIKQQAPQLFRQIPPIVWQKKWVVHCKAVANGNAVVNYFAPYVFQVAISNKGLIKLENHQITFAYKDTDSRRWKTMTLPVFEFIRRFLLYALPNGLKKVRYFGYLSSRNNQLLSVLHDVLGTVQKESLDKPDTENKVPHCSICGKPMILIEFVGRGGFDVPKSISKLAEKPP